MMRSGRNRPKPRKKEKSVQIAGNKTESGPCRGPARKSRDEELEALKCNFSEAFVRKRSFLEPR